MTFLAITLLIWIAKFIAFVLAPAVVLFADSAGRLPRPFQWMETFDNLGWAGPQSEPATAKYYHINPKLGLLMWLWRNSCYTLREKFKATPAPDAPTRERGSRTPPKWGFWYWLGTVGEWFQFRVGISLGKGYIYLQAGWQIRPWVLGSTPGPAAGLPIGIALRTDDWDG